MITEIFAHKDINVSEIINTFWDEFKAFQNQTGVFSNQSRWNAPDILKGKSHTWYKKYSLQFTAVFGYVGCRCTSKILGIGGAEQAWGDVKTLKTDKRAYLSSKKKKMQSIIYTTAKLHQAQTAQT